MHKCKCKSVEIQTLDIHQHLHDCFRKSPSDSDQPTPVPTPNEGMVDGAGLSGQPPWRLTRMYKCTHTTHTHTHHTHTHTHHTHTHTPHTTHIPFCPLTHTHSDILTKRQMNLHGIHMTSNRLNEGL